MLVAASNKRVLGVNQIVYDLMKFINDRVPGNVTTVKIQFFSMYLMPESEDLPF